MMRAPHTMRNHFLRFSKRIQAACALVFMIFPACSQISPIVIDPPTTFQVSVKSPIGGPIEKANVTYNLLTYSPTVADTVPPTPYTVPGDLQESATPRETDESGKTSFALPRHGSFSTQDIVVAEADFGKMYGFVIDDVVTVDLTSTALYELIAYSPVPVTTFSIQQMKDLLVAANSVITFNIEHHWIEPKAEVSQLHVAYKNALAKNAVFMAKLSKMALDISPKYNLLAYVPYQKFNFAPKILGASPNTAYPSVVETNPLKMQISANDTDRDPIFYQWVVTQKIPANASDPELKSGLLAHSLVAGNTTTAFDFVSGYDTNTWYQAVQTVYLTAVISDGGSAVIQSWSINVLNKERTPEFTTTPTLAAKEDTAWTYTPAATSPDQAPIRFALVNPLVSGMDMCIADAFSMETPPIDLPALGQAPHWNWQIAGTPCTSPNQIIWTPKNCQAGPRFSPISVKVQATDYTGALNVQAFAISVEDVDHAPTFTSLPPNLTITGPVNWTYQPTVFDPEADPLELPAIVQGNNPSPYIQAGGNGCADSFTFSFLQAPSGASIDPITGAISWTPTGNQVGTQDFAIQVEDAHGGVARQNWSVQVNDMNVAPVFVTACDPTAHESATSTPRYHCTVSVQEWTRNSKFILTVAGAPAGMTYFSGLTPATAWSLDWNLTDADTPSSYPMTLTVCNDGENGIFAPLCTSQSFTLSAPKEDIAPQFTTSPPVVVMGGDTYTYTALISDGNTNPPDTFTYTLTQPVPAGSAAATKTVNSATAPNGSVTINWAVNNTTDLGFHNLTLKADDGSTALLGPLSATQSWSVFVQETNYTPSITSTAPLTGVRGTDYVYPVVCTTQAVTSPNNKLTYSLVAGPTGMVIDAKTGRITWTPTPGQAREGSTQFTVSCDSLQGTPKKSTTQTNTVTLTYVNLPPEWVPVPDQTVAINTPVSLLVQAYETDGDTVSVSASGLPSGASFQANGSTGTLTWSPTFADVGNHAVTFTTTDNASPPLSRNMVVHFNVVNQPLFKSTPLTHANVDDPYQYEIHALDPAGQGLTYSVDSGPQGLSLTPIVGDSAATILSWRPSASFTGSNTVNLRATDANGNSATQSWQITVTSNTNVAPVISTTTPTIGANPITATEGRSQTYSAAATDSNGDSLHYAFYWDGKWKYDASNSFAYVPGSTEAGEHTLDIAVSDGASEPSIITMNIHVRDALPVTAKTYTYSGGAITSALVNSKNSRIFVQQGGSSPSLSVIDENKIDEGPITTISLPVASQRMVLQNGFADANFFKLYFVKWGDLLANANTFLSVAQDSFFASTCDSTTCFGPSFLQGGSAAGGSKVAYTGSSNKTFYIKSSDRRYVGAYSGSTAQADIDLGAGASANSILYDSTSAKVFVSVGGLDQVAVIDPVTMTITSRMNLTAGARPTALYLNSLTSNLYVYSSTEGSVSEISTSTLTRNFTTLGFPTSTSIGADPDNVIAGNNEDNLLYLANADTSELIVYDLNTSGSQSLAISNGPNEVYYDSSARKVTVVSFAGKELLQLK